MSTLVLSAGYFIGDKMRSVNPTFIQDITNYDSVFQAYIGS